MIRSLIEPFSAVIIFFLVPNLPARETHRLYLEPLDHKNSSGDTFIEGVNQIDHDAGRLYFRSLGDAFITVTDFEGNVLEILGSPGNGPGEFNRGVLAIAVNKDLVWAQDAGNWQKMNLFSHGKFVRSFKIDSVHINFATTSNAFDFTEDVLVLPCNPGTGHLAGAYYTNGTKKGVGELLFQREEESDLIRRVPEINNTFWLHHRNRWYCLFKYVPVLQIYSKTFQLIDTIDLESSIIRERAADILEHYPKVPGNWAQPLFYDVCISGRYLFAIAGQRHLHQFDLNTGKVIAIYTFHSQHEDLPKGPMGIRIFTVNDAGRVFFGSEHLGWGHDFAYADLPRHLRPKPIHP